MSKLTSANPEEREEAVRSLVRRLLSEASLTEAARAVGRSRQMMAKQLEEGEHVYLRLSDLPILEAFAPGIANALLAPLGLRVTPTSGGGTMTDILDGLAATMKHMGALTSKTTAALPDGIDNAEARQIQREVEHLHAKLGALSASVDAAVVGR